MSVIIPTHNRAHTLPRAIDSVLAQNASELIDSVGIVVIDDGSDDDTEELITKTYPQVIYLKQANKGVSAARNLGINHAFEVLKSQWIALLDSDDEWLPNKLKEQAEALQNTDVIVCHTEEIWIRDGVRVNQMKKHRKHGGWIYKQCLPLCAMSPSSILLHRDVFDNVGLFDVDLPACEDYDLWLRITARYEVVFVEKECIVKYGGHADQLSRRHWGMDRFRVIALNNTLVNCDLNEEQTALTKQMLIKKLTILQKGAAKHQNETLFDDCSEKLKRWQ